jgi:amino acid transporter
VANGLMDALGYYWPELRAGALRMAALTLLVVVIMLLNIRGVRQSAIVVNIFTIAKLTPLVLFVLLGLPYVSVEALRPDDAVTFQQISAAALLLIFAYGGYEVIPVPAGEARDPRRAVPFAMIATIVTVAIVMTAVQVVALGTLPAIAASRTPLADAALLFLGGFGALMMTGGAAISMTGNNVGQALSGSRNLFALAEQRDLPRAFGHVHPRYHTPDFAIVFTCVITLVLAVSGSFAALAATSAVTRLLVYAGTCASVLALRRQGRAPFTIPGGPAVPVLALVISVAILYGANAAQLQAGAIALVLGAVLYAIARGSARGRIETA